MANQSNTIDPGEIRFLNNSIPPLTAGTYDIDVTQNVQIPYQDEDTLDDVNQNYAENQPFIVQAPRFSLPATAIHSQFPAPGSKGEYSQNLPFITFESEQLPWMRTLKGADTLANPPAWMALLLFEEDELIYVPPQQGNPSPTKTTLFPIEEVINPIDSTIVGPDITLDPIEQGQADDGSLSAYAIDVAASIFNTLAPTLAELPFLAHLREINAGLEAIDGMTGSGYFPIIVSNRMPKPGVTYIAHLVSLEGYGERLPEGNVVIPNDKTVRLVSLQSWNFETEEGGANFTALVEALDKGLTRLDFTPPPSWGDPLTAAQKEVQDRYEKGYVALNSVTRLGESTFSWYRGPLCPIIPDHIINTDPDAEQPLLGADEALIYDPLTGIFDQSYAAAWETGRLVTLADASASQAIYAWKKEGIALLKLVDTLIKELPEDESLDVHTLKRMVRDSKSGNKKFMNYLAGRLGKLLTENRPESGKPLVPLGDPSRLRKRLKTIPGLVDPEAFNKAVAQGEDPHLFIQAMLRKSKLTKKKK